jgi:peptidoglycan/xylan/chitin deacetylase (PgdA/CDA1 family)
MVRTQLGLAAAMVGIASMTACSADPSASQAVAIPAEEVTSPSSTPTAASDNARDNAGTDTSATIQTPNRKVKVSWGHGENPEGGDVGIPEYAHWYERAIGQPTKTKVIYLTIDDGPSEYTQPLIDIFKKNDAVGTWFLIGNQAESQPELVKKLHKAGMAIGSHTWDHPNLNTLSDQEVRKQFESTNRAVGPVMGSCMRPPYGLINSSAARISESLGQVPVIWTGHAADWSSPPADQMVETFKSFTEPGAVLLMHDGGGDRSNTVEAMRKFIPWLKDKGYEIEAVPSCLDPLPNSETRGAVKTP